MKIIYALFFLLLSSCLALYGQASPDCKVIYVDHAEGNPGQTVCVDIKVKGFQEMLGAQFTLNWDPQQLEFSNLDNLNLPNLVPSNFGATPALISSGKLSFAWFFVSAGQDGVSVEDDGTIFTLCFEVKGNSGDFAPISFTQSPTQTELTGWPGPSTFKNYLTISGGVFIGDFPETTPLEITSECAAALEENPTNTYEAIIEGGATPYTYEWSGQGELLSNTATLADFGPGRYRLRVTDANEQVLLVDLSAGGEPLEGPVETSDPELIIPHATVEAGGGVCLDVISKGLQNVTGFDMTFQWDSSIVQLDAIPLVNLPNEWDDIISFNEKNNTYTLSRNYEDPVNFEDNNSLFNLCFSGVAQGGSSPVSFDNILTRIRFEDGREEHPIYNNGRITLRSTDTLTLRVEATGANPEDTVCVPVTSENFNNISSLQYALQWDERIVDLIEVKAGYFPLLDGGNFYNWDMNEQEPGVLHFIGHSTEGLSLPDGTIHYELCFEALSGGVVDIEFSNEQLPTEAYNNQDQLVIVQTNPGLINIGEVPPQPMLVLGTAIVDVGKEICIDLDGEQFSYVRKMDLDFSWDSDIVQLSRVKGGDFPGFGLDNWAIDHTAPGRLFLRWEDQDNPVYFYREKSLLEICFTAERTGNTALSWGNDYVFQSDDLISDPMFFDGNIRVEDIRADSVAFHFPDLEVSEGGTICVPFYTNGFDSIIGLQYSQHWDPDVLRLDSIKMGQLPNLSLKNFGLTLGPDVLTFSWTSGGALEPVILPDSSVLYYLCFTALGKDGELSYVSTTGKPTPIEVVFPSERLAAITLDPGRVAVSRNFVWPGDTDHNGIANHQDLLNIGLAYGESGPQRHGNSQEWRPFAVADWEEATPATLLNFKHIDSDGNGIINALDTAAIVRNWGQITPWYEAPDEGIIQFEPAQGAPLFVAAREEVRPGKNTFDVILGTQSDPAEDVYGLAFSIIYDYEGIDSEKAYARFDTSWLGQVGENLLPLQRNDPVSNRIDIAITRIDGKNISGQGVIASLHLTIEDIILLEGDDDLIHFRIENVKAINVNEEERPTAPAPSSMLITQQTTPVYELLDPRFVDLYPNPANQQLHIDARGIQPERLSILTPQGVVIRQMSYEPTISLDQLEAGYYLLKLGTKGQSIVKPFIIIH